MSPRPRHRTTVGELIVLVWGRQQANQSGHTRPAVAREIVAPEQDVEVAEKAMEEAPHPMILVAAHTLLRFYSSAARARTSYRTRAASVVTYE